MREFSAGNLGNSNSFSLLGSGSGCSMSGMFLDDIGEIAMECL